MHVIVLGGGVLGVSSAWYLSDQGHEVTVIERQGDVALETSYANAGMISPGYSSPWAGPGIPLKAIGWMLQDLAPFMINFKALDSQTISWMIKMLRNCNTRSYQINKSRMLRVANYSHACFQALRRDLDLDYDARQQGTLQLFRSDKQVAALQKDLEVLRDLGIEHQFLDMNHCTEYEPALAQVRDKFVGGLRLPNDETGDCFKFTNALAKACRAKGVKFAVNTDVRELVSADYQIKGVQTSSGLITGDAYVVALGSYSVHALKTVGIDIPVYPIKGYSLTLPIEDATRAPQSTIMDETYKVAVTRFDDRIRVGGTAEISSYNLECPTKRRASVDFVVQDMFPGAVDVSKAEFWSGLRPMTPDSTPIIGGTGFNNLYINTGHGTLGWTMSLGSAKLLADLISHRTPDIDPEGLSLARYA